MENEILACIEDKNIKFLHSGQISKYIFPLEREEAHIKNISHLIIRIFVMAILPDNEVLYLVQKRGKKKKTYPEYFTDSASGHVIFKKNLNLDDIVKNAKRELEEEFGIPQKEILKLKFYELKAEENKKTTEIAYVFIGLINSNITLNPNPKELEVKESRFYSKSELKNLIENEKSIDYSRDIWKKLININIKDLFEIKRAQIEKKSKKKEIAFFIGRFQPLHHGHIYVLNYILKSYKMVKIGIGSSQLSYTLTDPFTGEERIRFISQALKVRNIPSSRFKIYEIPDIFNAKKWVEHVISIVGEFDTVFSNSEWVRQLFQKEGYNVGKKLVIFKKKYNATNIRSLISKDNKNWIKLVPKEVANLILEFHGIKRIKKKFIESENK